MKWKFSVLNLCLKTNSETLKGEIKHGRRQLSLKPKSSLCVTGKHVTFFMWNGVFSLFTALLILNIL